MDYNFKEIEQRQQRMWAEKGIYKVDNKSDKPKFYVLDMFPYPSGAGLHVGHPLGYIASDIYARYKRLQGFNVLHPMGFDAYGLPAEQYAIQTGQHPEITTNKNIARYCEQLSKIGFCYDWDREVRTCDPDYYKWTQWAFREMFLHYYDTEKQQARPIAELVAKFEATDPTWATKTQKEKEEILMNYRIAYLADTKVNWCPALGTVLANDEVSEGLSVRGGHPVEQRVMRQWSLRVSAYAERLLKGLDNLDWTDSLKETQRNWIGKSEGAEMYFPLAQAPQSPEGDACHADECSQHPLQGAGGLTIFTTRADTVFGVTFMVLAPESEYVNIVTTADQKAEVDAYIAGVKNRTERERIADRKVSGVFTGSYAINPLTNQEIPIYISDYVLSGYGTGAIMAVPAHDSRDYAFAKHFNLPIIPLIEGCDVSESSFDAKEGVMMNSGFLNGLQVKDAIAAMKKHITETGIGHVQVNYRLRDAIFSRQRYWGEPFPVYYKDGMPQMLPAECLPLELPEMADFKPNASGEPPLANAPIWAWDEKNKKVVDKKLLAPQPPKGGVGDADDTMQAPPSGGGGGIYPLELCTMPGFAGSSAYYLRYMDNHNSEALVGKEANDYWQQVDLYIGGTEHATGHLIYSRFWNKFLFDLGVICKDEPYAKLINQGMIQGRSNFVYRVLEGEYKGYFVSFGQKDNYQTQPIHVDVNIVSNDILDIDHFRAWLPEYKDAQFIFEDGSKSFSAAVLCPSAEGGPSAQRSYKCGWAIEKMSKSMFNVVNPDDIVERFGADTLRLYEMFLGPLEQSKPWDTNGIDGVHRFLKKLWSMFENISDEAPTADELRTLHKTIKKVTYDIEHFSFNTSIPAFMICQNELQALKCNKRAILEPIAILLAPFAPHIAEEMWQRLHAQQPSNLGTFEPSNVSSIFDAQWPLCEEKYLVESSVKYPISFNGKTRFTLELPKDMSKEDIEKTVLAHEDTQRFLAGNTPKKVIVVPGRIVNIVM